MFYKETFKLELAGYVFEISGAPEYLKRAWHEYLTDKPADTFISALPDSEAFMRARREITEEDPDISIILHCMVCEYLLSRNVLPFHASALMYGGRAYLFTAPSGTGKSTHSRLWRERFGDKVTMINDDKPFLSLEENGFRAWGSPWYGKERIHSNISAPVAGIVSLYQAKENTIRRISRDEAFPLLLRQTHIHSDIKVRLKIFGLVDKLCKLPVYSLGCSISYEAAELAEKTLTGES